MIPGLLAAFGLLFAVRPRAGEISEVENRPLAKPPRCDSAARWFDGSCAREIDLYVADHFPGRERFVTAAGWMKAHRGLPLLPVAPRVVEVRSMDEGWIERLEDWIPLDGGVDEEAPGEDHAAEPLLCPDVEDRGAAVEACGVASDGSAPNRNTVQDAAGSAPAWDDAAPRGPVPGEPPGGGAADADGARQLPVTPGAASLAGGAARPPKSAAVDGLAGLRPPRDDGSLSCGPCAHDPTGVGAAPSRCESTGGRAEQEARDGGSDAVAAAPSIEISVEKAHALPAPGSLLDGLDAGLAPPLARPVFPLDPLPVPLAAGGLGAHGAGSTVAAGGLSRTALKPTKVEISNGILVTGNRAMQLFGGTAQTAQAYADVINSYAERLAGKVKVHSVVVPSAVSFHLPPDQAYRSRSEQENLATLASALRPDVSHPDTFPALQAHAADEPLYLRTDHHWNGLGAYRAYEAFCRSAGFVSVPLPAFHHGQKPGFLGSYAAFTQDAALRSAPDVVDHYEPPVTYTATRFANADGGGTGHPARFVDPQLRGYLVFLGGDSPLLHATTDVRNGRRAVLVKNSFGNPFAPLLLSHFEELYVVDYRYYAGSLDALVQRTAATDLIFFNVTLLANSAPHRQRLAALGRGSKAWAHPTAARPDAGTTPDSGEPVDAGQPPEGGEPGDAGE